MGAGRAEDFLELVERGRRGRLKLYLGFAAGVGKTYRMLQDAHALKARGVDVVLAFIETHGRPDTQALVAGLETVPRARFTYRDVVVEELDLEGVLARRPQVAVVDELAHTNVPLCRHTKRHQDVEALLAAGIHVLGAFNVQHLESLNDLLERAIGVRVRETLPDRFLASADQVVNLDLTVEDLHERLEAGKIYPPDRVPRSLERFFRPENLSTLRELALREVAGILERATTGPRARTTGEEPPRRDGDWGRLMVALSSSPPHAATLLRRGARLAGRLNTDWFVVYVETPREAPHLIDAEAQRHLLANIERARELGAEVVRLQSADPVGALLDFARSHGVGHILVGRSRQPWWRRALGLASDARLLREGEGFDIQVVSFAPWREERRP